MPFIKDMHFMRAIYIFSALFGLCVGSFLNVVILRLPKEEKITGRSKCPYCKKNLSFFDLIPVLSYLFLKGKCRYCKKKISFQYPLIEAVTALFFVLLVFLINKLFLGANIFLLSLNLIFWFFFISVLIIVFATDFKYYIVPDRIIYPAIIIAIIYQIINSFLSSKPLIINAILAGLSAAFFLLFLVLVTKGKGMGLGDVKIAAFMGILLSFPNILVALLLAFFSGSIIGLILIFFKKKTLKSEIPFGCFLAPATFIAFFWGSQLINWYYGFLLK
jgi:prepilin signal peptidase PulO-like enzyme (type II secretory pathway)